MENKSKSELETLIDYMYDRVRKEKNDKAIDRICSIIKVLNTAKYILDMNESVAGYFNEEYLFDKYLGILLDD